MKIISYNLNGIRAAITKGLLEWIQIENPDILCFQETKAHVIDIDTAAFEALGYHCYWHSAEKKGYSSVGIISKIKPNEVVIGCGNAEIDREGRVITAYFDTFYVVNTYFPSGTTGGERQEFKMKFLEFYMNYINGLRSINPNIIVLGDYNIAHTEIDIHDPKGNKNSSGFLPEERAWLDTWFTSEFTDSFRHIHKNALHKYSWWSYRANSRNNNKGWRIDYISVANVLKDKIIHSDILADVVHSDHCPISVILT